MVNHFRAKKKRIFNVWTFLFGLVVPKKPDSSESKKKPDSSEFFKK